MAYSSFVMFHLGVSICTLVTAMCSPDTPKQISLYLQFTRPAALSRKISGLHAGQLYGNRYFITEIHCFHISAYKGLGLPTTGLQVTV